MDFPLRNATIHESLVSCATFLNCNLQLAILSRSFADVFFFTSRAPGCYPWSIVMNRDSPKLPVK